MEGHVVDAGVSQPEEDSGVSRRIAAEVGGHHHVVAVAKESAQHPAESHLDQGHVLLRGKGRPTRLTLQKD